MDELSLLQNVGWLIMLLAGCIVAWGAFEIFWEHKERHIIIATVVGFAAMLLIKWG